MSATPQSTATPTHRRVMWVVIGALVMCLVVGLVVPMDHLDGKGWPARAVTYPLSALVVPLVWHLRGRRSSFPHLANALIVTPFVLDLAGNLFGFFDNVTNFDDALHFVNWGFLVGGVVMLLVPLGLERWNLIALGGGFGGVAIVLWEFIEYVVQETGTTGLNLTYEDTISDLMLSTAGGFVGAALVAVVQARSAAAN